MTDASTLPTDSGIAPAMSTGTSRSLRRWWPLAVVGLALLIAAGAVMAWRADQRVSHLEQELVRRQQDSAAQVAEARVLAKQAEESARESAAKLTLLEARVAEVTVQRGQLEELIQSMSRSRDENLLVDVEAAIRLGVQQSAITGSAEPLVGTLKQADERLARYDQPRLEGVRRAIARDLDRVKTASVADIPALGIKLDEAVRMVDELPLLGAPEMRRDPTRAAPPLASTSTPAAAASGTGLASASGWQALWPASVGEAWDALTSRLWSEVRSLVRVTRIDRPEAALLAPEQAFFLRENLKLRLLNARLALLSRQFDTAQVDLRAARSAIERYFDPGSRRSVLVLELLKQVATQARQVGIPRPDDTLAALAAASAGR